MQTVTIQHQGEQEAWDQSSAATHKPLQSSRDGRNVSSLLSSAETGILFLIQALGNCPPDKLVSVSTDSKVNVASKQQRERGPDTTVETRESIPSGQLTSGHLPGQ